MNNEIKIKTSNGIIRATISDVDENYRGIWLEYIPNNDNGENASRFQCLMEEVVEQKQVRLLVWNNPNEEDYTMEIENKEE